RVHRDLAEHPPADRREPGQARTLEDPTTDPIARPRGDPPDDLALTPLVAPGRKARELDRHPLRGRDADEFSGLRIKGVVLRAGRVQDGPVDPVIPRGGHRPTGRSLGDGPRNP